VCMFFLLPSMNFLRTCVVSFTPVVFLFIFSARQAHCLFSSLHRLHRIISSKRYDRMRLERIDVDEKERRPKSPRACPGNSCLGQ